MTIDAEPASGRDAAHASAPANPSAAAHASAAAYPSAPANPSAAAHASAAAHTSAAAYPSAPAHPSDTPRAWHAARADARPLDLSGARAVAERAVRDGRLPAAVFGVADATETRGVVVVNGEGRLVARTSLFFLASVTKPIVATAVMQLVDEGRLDLHAPIARYLPQFRGGGRERVTPWHVLTHTSGLPDQPLDDLRHDRPDHAEGLRRALTSVPTSEPGTRFAYASSPWFLLAALISRLTGMPFETALRRRLLEPLGMRDTTFDARRARHRLARVEGARASNPIVREVLLRFMARAMLPGGGLFGTVDDLLRFGRALLPADADGPSWDGPRVLSAAAIEAMTTEQTRGLLEVLPDGTSAEPRYALGWRKPKPAMPGSARAFMHGGITGGRVWIDPDAGMAYAFLSDRWEAPDGPSYEVLAEVYRAWDAPLDPVRRQRLGPPGS